MIDYLSVKIKMGKISLLLLVSLAVLALALAFNLSERERLLSIENREHLGKVSGVSAERSVPVEDQETRARTIAKDYVERMDFYLDGQGENLVATKVTPLSGSNRWLVYLTFEIGPILNSESTGTAEVRVVLEDWQVKDVLYTKGEIAVLSVEECQGKGARLVDLTGGENCRPEEAEIGEIQGFDGQYLCCLGKK